MERTNPYYNPEKFGLTTLSFDEPNMCYEYNIMCFWLTSNGQIYYKSDSGCSCPTPFELYEGTTQDEVLQKLDRIGSVEQAEAVFESWNNGKLPIAKKNFLGDWVKANLKA